MLDHRLSEHMQSHPGEPAGDRQRIEPALQFCDALDRRNMSRAPRPQTDRFGTAPAGDRASGKEDDIPIDRCRVLWVVDIPRPPQPVSLPTCHHQPEAERRCHDEQVPGEQARIVRKGGRGKRSGRPHCLPQCSRSWLSRSLRQSSFGTDVRSNSRRMRREFIRHRTTSRSVTWSNHS